MINLNEATAANRRIPFYLTNSSGTAQTGIVITGSELRLSKNGGAFANFAGTITEIGNGLYYYLATAAEVNTPGFLALLISKTGIKLTCIVETIGAPTFYSTLRLPFFLVNSSGAAQTGLTFAASEIKVTENGTAFANYAGTMTEVGSGLYYYTPAATEFDGAGSGFIAAAVIKTGVQTLMVSQDMEEGFKVDVTDPTVTVVSTPSTEENALVVSVWDAVGFEWMELLCRDRDGGPQLVVYDSSEGFLHPFGGRSSRTGSGTQADPYIFTVYRRGRWPTGLDLGIKIRVVDVSGNVKQTSTTISL